MLARSPKFQALLAKSRRSIAAGRTKRETVHLEDPAAVPAQDQEHRGADPLAVPQGRQHRRLQRGPGGPARARMPRVCRRRRSRGSRAVWEEEYEDWSKRSLAGKQYVYVWADGVHFNIRLEEDRQCILVLMGATADGKKELIAVPRRLPRERAVVEGAAPGLQGAAAWRSIRSWRSATGRWASGRRCGKVCPDDAGAALLGAQDGQRARQAAQEACSRKAKEMLHEIWMAETQARREAGVRPVRGDVRGEVPEGDASAWRRIATCCWRSTTRDFARACM